MTQPLRFGLTAAMPCSYLPDQQEQLVFLLPGQPVTEELYRQLMASNFRRSGEQVYTPHCSACQACQSVRLPVNLFRPSRSQRRLLNKAQRMNWRYRLADQACADYFDLFEHYVAFKHADGVMYPATPEQLEPMLHCSWLPVKFLEQYYNDTLVSVTIVDVLADSYSAVYTFFSASVSAFSPGILAVLNLVTLARQQGKTYLYLGFYIENCQKMNYKAAFMPQQRLIQGQWHSFA